VDQSNLLEFFECAVTQEQPVTASSSVVLKVHWGRLRAAKYFFRLEEARKDRKLWDSFKVIANHYRNFLCLQLVQEKLKQDLELATKKAVDLGRTIEDQISKCAFTYTCMEDSRIRPEMIIAGSENVTKEVREKIMLNCQL
jgi:hypothetical protein